MHRTSLAAILLAAALLAAGAARAESVAQELAISAGMIAGAADACGATDTSMFQFKTEKAIEDVALDDDDKTRANKAYFEAKRNGLSEQRLHAPMPCRDVLRLYRQQPLWENY